MSDSNSFYGRQKQLISQKQIASQNQFEVQVVGVTFDNRQEVVKRLQSNDSVILRRDPRNSHDRNAIRVETVTGQQIGFLERELAQRLAPAFDSFGRPVTGTVIARVGGEMPGSSYGVRIRFLVPSPADITGPRLPDIQDQL